MALIFADGFDTYDNGNDMLAAGWVGDVGNRFFIPDHGTVRNGQTSLRCNSSAGNIIFRFKSFVPNGPILIIGWAWYLSNFPGGTGNHVIQVAHFSGSSFWVGVNSAGRMMVGWGIAGPTYDDNSGPTNILWTSSVTEPMNQWNYFEVKVHLATDQTGSFELRKNGVTMGFQSGVKTCGAVALPNAISFGAALAPWHGNIDDLYICDGSGTINNDFLGDVSVVAIYPNADVQANWTRNTGATNASAVDDLTPDYETTYVSAASAMVDEYTVNALPASVAGIIGVIPTLMARKDNTGMAKVRNRIVSNGIVAVGATVGLGTTYMGVSDVFEVDPHTGLPWTTAAVNALTFGPHRVS